MNTPGVSLQPHATSLSSSPPEDLSHVFDQALGHDQPPTKDYKTNLQAQTLGVGATCQTIPPLGSPPPLETNPRRWVTLKLLIATTTAARLIE